MKISVIIPTQNRAADVVDCIDSVLASDFSDLEIIVLDNASDDDTVSALKNKFGTEKKVRIMESEINLGAGGGRNLGAKEAAGEYLLFLDSDNVIDPKMIALLVEFLEKKCDCGMVGPLMLFKKDPSLIWTYFADIDMWTSRALYKGSGEKDQKQYSAVESVGHIPNCFMIKKADFEKVGGFDEKYLVMFEEADFAERVKRLGKKICIYTKAKTFHNVPLPEDCQKGEFTFKDEKIAFLTARNRTYFMRKNALIINLFLFLLIFNPAILIYYEFSLLKNKQFKLAGAYLRGFLAGHFM